MPEHARKQMLQRLQHCRGRKVETGRVCTWEVRVASELERSILRSSGIYMNLVREEGVPNSRQVKETGQGAGVSYLSLTRFNPCRL
jgi:hypothetical protein